MEEMKDGIVYIEKMSEAQQGKQIPVVPPCASNIHCTDARYTIRTCPIGGDNWAIGQMISRLFPRTRLPRRKK
jgi:hypothetical protein